MLFCAAQGREDDVSTVMKADGGVRRVVLVDDEPVILQILSAVLEDGPWEITACGSASEARRVLRSDGVDLLITDKNLPDGNGLELLKLAREVNDLAEVIIITGYANLETALTAMELDAFDYVLKPLNNVFDIRKKVQRAVDKQDLAKSRTCARSSRGSTPSPPSARWPRASPTRCRRRCLASWGSLRRSPMKRSSSCATSTPGTSSSTAGRSATS